MLVAVVVVEVVLVALEDDFAELADELGVFEFLVSHGILGGLAVLEVLLVLGLLVGAVLLDLVLVDLALGLLHLLVLAVLLDLLLLLLRVLALLVLLEQLLVGGVARVVLEGELHHLLQQLQVARLLHLAALLVLLLRLALIVAVLLVLNILIRPGELLHRLKDAPLIVELAHLQRRRVLVPETRHLLALVRLLLLILHHLEEPPVHRIEALLPLQPAKAAFIQKPALSSYFFTFSSPKLACCTSSVSSLSFPDKICCRWLSYQVRSLMFIKHS